MHRLQSQLYNILMNIDTLFFNWKLKLKTVYLERRYFVLMRIETTEWIIKLFLNRIFIICGWMLISVAIDKCYLLRKWANPNPHASIEIEQTELSFSTKSAFSGNRQLYCYSKMAGNVHTGHIAYLL